MKEDEALETGTTADDNVLHQADPEKWKHRPPKKMRGDIRQAMRLGAEAEKYNCSCWHKSCPFFGDCRKCLVFHMSLKQLPTCQRDMVIEMYREGYLADELYMEEECAQCAKERAAEEGAAT